MSGTSLTVSVDGTSYSSPEAAMRSVADKLKGGVAAAAQDLPLTVRQWLTEMVAALSAKHNGAWPGGTGTDSLSRRSGTLLQQLQDGLQVASLSSFEGVMGSLSGGGYTALHEFGGTLSPSSGRFLTIPLREALKADGTPLKSDPRDWRDTFVQKSRAGNLLIFQRAGKGIVPLYVLKPSVSIPPRLGARSMAEERMPYFVEKCIDLVLSKFST